MSKHSYYTSKHYTDPSEYGDFSTDYFRLVCDNITMSINIVSAFCWDQKLPFNRDLRPPPVKFLSYFFCVCFLQRCNVYIIFASYSPVTWSVCSQKRPPVGVRKLPHLVKNFIHFCKVKHNEKHELLNLKYRRIISELLSYLTQFK